ncbi:MAG: plasmid maintenance system antidote protein [Pedobacter sp.]|nr:plasmid maintenance system antidote protein [Pedobacter sp.]MDQ8051543.1 plasmid maintenance system antidote protein [Pedobacter sp.]
MFEKLSILKGLHPGFFLAHELKKQKLSKRQFALSLSEHPQTIGTITKGKRDMNTALSLKAENALGLEEGFLMMLQTFYDIKLEKDKNKDNRTPNLKLIRPVLFWDTKMDKIDWDKHKEFIIERIFERGDEEEQKEIQKFYGKQVIADILSKEPKSNYIRSNKVKSK